VDTTKWKAIVAVKVANLFFEEDGLVSSRKEIPLNEPFQIMAKAGTVIVAHRMLPHSTAPNRSDSYVRRILWFRVRCAKRTINVNDPETFLDIWKEWKPLLSCTKRNLYYTITNPVLRQYYTDCLSKVRQLGYGHVMSITPDLIVIRCRPLIGEPKLYAGMVTVKCEYLTGEITVHTGGFIARSHHKRMTVEIQSKTQNTIGKGIPVVDLLQVAEYIRTCHYRDMIERWCPRIPCTNDSPLEKRVLRFHHFNSKTKSTFVQVWAQQLDLMGLLCNGKPGFLVVVGKLENVQTFFTRFECFHWLKVKSLNVDFDHTKLEPGFHRTMTPLMPEYLKTILQ